MTRKNNDWLVLPLDLQCNCTLQKKGENPYYVYENEISCKFCAKILATIGIRHKEWLKQKIAKVEAVA